MLPEREEICRCFLIPTAALPIPTLPCCSSLCREGEDPAGPRAATLTVARGAGRTAAKAVDTPACMLFTRSGHPPSLLPDLLQQVPDLTVAMVSYRSLWLTPGPKVLADFGKGVGAFVNMPADTVVVCGASDPENMPPDGCVPHARVLHRQQQPRSGLPMLPRFSVISISFLSPTFPSPTFSVHSLAWLLLLGPVLIMCMRVGCTFPAALPRAAVCGVRMRVLQVQWCRRDLSLHTSRTRKDQHRRYGAVAHYTPRASLSTVRLN